MKKLFFIRHGKATQEFMDDKDRYLIDKGVKRTLKNARKLKESRISPDLILSSPAVRAYQTAEIIADTLGYPKENIVTKENFYFAPEDLVVNEILSLPNEVDTVFLVGHNPLWTEMANYFSSHNIGHLRTSGVVGVEFQTDDWTEIGNVPKSDIFIQN